MADINSGSSGTPHAGAGYRGGAQSAEAGDGAGDEALLGVVELLFFAYRDFTGEADAVLQEFGFGRAHHRVLHFVNRRPGLRVADLLDILRITKQSLARVLKQLVDRSFIAQEAGDTDRRERRLFLTPKGKELAVKLARLQVAQVGHALAGAGGADRDADSGQVRQVLLNFLLAMIGPEQRATIAATIASTTAGRQSSTVGASTVGASPSAGNRQASGSAGRHAQRQAGRQDGRQAGKSKGNRAVPAKGEP